QQLAFGTQPPDVRETGLDGGNLRERAGFDLHDALANGVQQLPVGGEIPTELFLQEGRLRRVVCLSAQLGAVADTEEPRRAVPVEIRVRGRGEMAFVQPA